jgi:hypothetical protein
MAGLNQVLAVLEQLAPTIAAVLKTPLLGSAIAVLESVLGLTPGANASVDERAMAVAQAIEGASPEALAAIRRADQDYAAAMAELGFKNKEAFEKLERQTQKFDIDEVANARGTVREQDNLQFGLLHFGNVRRRDGGCVMGMLCAADRRPAD